MKKDNIYFGQTLSKLNNKVNRRSSYLHDTSLKYHRGAFSHDRVIINLKIELYSQSPRYYMPYDTKTKSLAFSSSKAGGSKTFEDTLSMLLKTELVKFHQKAIIKRNHIIIPSKRISLKKTLKEIKDTTILP